MLSDIEIAESAKLKDIREVAKELGIGEDGLELYGRYKAKIAVPPAGDRQGKLILVTAINPTASGEGKTTVSIGLADGLRRIGVVLKRAQYFLLCKGRAAAGVKITPDSALRALISERDYELAALPGDAPEQLSLFDRVPSRTEVAQCLTGQL